MNLRACQKSSSLLDWMSRGSDHPSWSWKKQSPSLAESDSSPAWEKKKRPNSPPASKWRGYGRSWPSFRTRKRLRPENLPSTLRLACALFAGTSISYAIKWGLRSIGMPTNIPTSWILTSLTFHRWNWVRTTFCCSPTSNSASANIPIPTSAG